MARDDRPTWHPMLAAVEGPVGTWRMIDSLGKEYGTIRLVRIDGEPTYIATMRGRDIGSGYSFRRACEQVHRAFVHSVGQRGRIGFEPQADADARARRNAPSSPEDGGGSDLETRTAPPGGSQTRSSPRW